MSVMISLVRVGVVRMKKYEKLSSNIAVFAIDNQVNSIKTTSSMNVAITNEDVSDNHANQKSKVDCLKYVCWIIVPIITAALIVLDALNIYTFNVERLVVLGIGLLVVLLPFFSEITVKDISVKRNRTKSNT